MKNAVNRLYALLQLKATNPEEYAKDIAFGSRYPAGWEDPA